MTRCFISSVLVLAAGAILCSCGDDAPHTVVGADPVARQAALQNLQQLGLEFSPEAFLRELKGASRAEVLQLFLDAGLPAHGVTGSGETLLMVLIGHGTDKAEVVKSAKLLIDRGANVKAADRTGSTVLDYTFNTEVIAMLKAAGAKENPLPPLLNF